MRAEEGQARKDGEGEGALMPTFRLDLPPSANHGYKMAIHGSAVRGWRPAMVKTRELEQWESDAARVVGNWRPPKHRSLAMRIVIALPRDIFRRRDIDGMVKFLTDATVGRRADQWVDRLEVVKTVGDGWADVSVETI